MINLLRSEEGREVLHAIRRLEQESAGSVIEPATEFREASIEPGEIKVEVNDWNENTVQTRNDTARNTTKLCLNEESGKDVHDISKIFSEDKSVSFVEKEEIKNALGAELKNDKEDNLKVAQKIDLESVSENECLRNSVHENVVNQRKQHTYNTEMAVLSDAETESDQVIVAECGNEDFDNNEVENDIDMEIGNPDDPVFMPYISGQNVNVKRNADIDESGIKTGSYQTNVQFKIEESNMNTSPQISSREDGSGIIQTKLGNVSKDQLVQKSKQIRDKAAMQKPVKPDLYLILKPISTSPKQQPVMYLTNIKSVSQQNSGKVTSLSAGKIADLKIEESVKKTIRNDTKMEQTLINKKSEKNQVESPRPSANFVHTCKICGEEFIYLTHLRYHSRRTGHGNSKLEHGQCYKCGKLFKSRNDAWKHNNLYHQEDRQAKCELCSASFKNDYSLRQHLKVSHTIDPKKCLICSKTFRNKYLLKKHTLKTHDAKRFWCRVCERFLVNDIKAHMRTQGHLKKSLCMPTVMDGNVIKLLNETADSEANSSVTNKETIPDDSENRDIDGVLSKSEMVVEETSFTSDKRQNGRLGISSDIAESLSTETSLPPGIFENNGLPIVETNATLVDDLESSHMIATDINDRKEAAKIVDVSTISQKTCNPVTDVLYSATSMSKQEIRSSGNTSKGLKNATDHKCFVCHSDFSDVVLLTKHMKKEHPGTVETYMSYKCEICNQNFSHVYDLTKHRKEQHSGHRKIQASKTKRTVYQCDTCGRCLSSKICLDIHIATEHEYAGEIYTCDKCKATYRHPEFLKRHKSQYHPVNKPVTCNICKNVFASNNLLRKHKTRHYRKYWCKVCNKPFPHSTSLKDHQRTNTHLKLLEKIERGEDIPATEKFTCDLCDTELASKIGLSLHKTKIHQSKQNDTMN